MAKDQPKPIKVFVSYSWTTQEHEMRILSWAERLRGDGIDVVLDKWDYYVASLLRNRRYQILNSLLNRTFFLPPTANASSNVTKSFTAFWAGMKSLQYRNERLKLNRLDHAADLIQQRATLKQLPFESILQADVVLFTACLLDEGRRLSWYPRTLVYNQYGNTCELFARAVSKQYFENLKTIFGIASKEEFTTKIAAGFQRHGVNNWTQLTFYSDVSWNVLLNLEHLATTS